MDLQKIPDIQTPNDVIEDDTSISRGITPTCGVRQDDSSDRKELRLHSAKFVRLISPGPELNPVLLTEPDYEEEHYDSETEEDEEVAASPAESGYGGRWSRRVSTASCDTDLDVDINDLLNPERDMHDTSGRAEYVQACEEEGVVPSTYFLRHNKDKVLAMKFRGLGPRGTKAIAIPLENNTSIEQLDLEGNCIEDEGAVALSQVLKENYYINELKLSENHIGTCGTQAICSMLQDNHCIVKLDLSGNDLRDDIGLVFMDTLTRNTSLKHLYLSHNQIENTGARVFREILAQCESLETLDLSWNLFRTQGAVDIAEGLQENIGLKCLNISMNGISVAGAEALGTALKQNRTLLELDVSYGRIPKEGAEYIASGLQTNDILQTLKIGCNPLDATGAYSLLEAIEKNDISAMSLLDCTSVLVKEDFTQLHGKILESRWIDVKHGGVVKAQLPFPVYLTEDPMEMFMKNPMSKMREYIEDCGYRLIDLFKQFDKDQSMTVTKQEFIAGIEKANINLSMDQITALVDCLDADGNGVVDYGELVYGDKTHREQRRKLVKEKQMEEEEKAREKELERLEMMEAEEDSDGRRESLFLENARSPRSNATPERSRRSAGSSIQMETRGTNT